MITDLAGAPPFIIHDRESHPLPAPTEIYVVVGPIARASKAQVQIPSTMFEIEQPIDDEAEVVFPEQ